MNLEDLTRELEVQAAAGPAPLAGPARLDGVRRRIRLRRRRQAGAVVGLTALAVASVILVPGLNQRQADPAPVPAAPRPSDPLSFVPDVTGDPLLDQAVSGPGSEDLVLRFTPTDTNLQLFTFCHLPGARPGDGPITEADTTVNGHPVTGDHCDVEQVANQGSLTFEDDPAANRARWADFGVVAGRESVIRMTIKSKQGAVGDFSAVRLGVALYVLSGERIEDAGVRIKVLAESGGHRYRLAGHTAAVPTAKRRSLSLPVPAGDHPVLVLFGSPGDEVGVTTGASTLLYVDGDEVAGMSGGPIGLEPLADASAHTVEVRLEPGIKGTMVLAYYVQSD